MRFSQLIRLLFMPIILFAVSKSANGHNFEALVFTGTESGPPAASTDEGVAALQALALAHDFDVTVTTDAADFTTVNLLNYQIVIFLNTSGNVLDSNQEAAMEGFIQNGNGFVGIASAANTETAWPWYSALVGATYVGESTAEQANVHTLDRVHPISAALPARWTRTDVWYDFTANPRGTVHVLAVLDEKSYSGSAMGSDHPIAWCQNYDGGRSAYLGFGHTEASFSETSLQDLLTTAIEWAAKELGGDSTASIPSKYSKTSLNIPNLGSPMALNVDLNGNVYFIQRQTGTAAVGNVRKYNASNSQTFTLGNLDVYSGGEFGLLGIALAPDFDTSKNLYLCYTPTPDTATIQRLSRFTLNASEQLDNEQVILEYPVLRPSNVGGLGHHQGGGLRFDTAGNLLLSTGDGMVDLLEYGLGSDPMTHSIEDLPVLLRDEISGEMSIRYDRPVGLADLSYTLLGSDDLLTWVPLTPQITLTPDGSGMEEVIYSDLETAATAAGLSITDRCFYRLNLQLTHPAL